MKNWIVSYFFSDESVKVCQSLKSALEMLQEGPYAEEIENIWIIGGASVYRVCKN